MSSSVFLTNNLDDLRAVAPKNSAVTLGVFDGVHLGHRQIIKELVQASKKEGIDGCFLVTFDPHPLVVTHSKITPPMLTTIEERVALLSQFDLDGVVVLPFDDELANLDYRKFLDRYLLKPFDMRLLVLGYDCYFGRNREGSPDKVGAESNKLGIEVKVVPAYRSNDEIVSSTRIRNALIEGDLAGANELLGHPYLLSGTVVRGHGKGRGLGFPTANITIEDPYKLWPPPGVYAVRVQRDHKLHDGMMNIGRAPTMKNLTEDAKEIEVHLFDFDRDLYGENLRVFCHGYLRGEKRFPSPESLVRQLGIDRVEAARCLGEAPGEKG